MIKVNVRVTLVELCRGDGESAWANSSTASHEFLAVEFDVQHVFRIGADGSISNADGFLEEEGSLFRRSGLVHDDFMQACAELF